MPDTVGNLVSLLFIGFLLGIRHATDADHIVAIATIVSRQRHLWGFGDDRSGMGDWTYPDDPRRRRREPTHGRASEPSVILAKLI
jgi:hypothetical protein